ncbi:MAG: hypothetical protein LBR22_08865 [Desulfovibrio sp.]|jgi:hypothetical protein|nr:hypothetical protein [Desulfovibrio sp.]
MTKNRYLSAIPATLALCLALSIGAPAPCSGAGPDMELAAEEWAAVEPQIAAFNANHATCAKKLGMAKMVDGRQGCMKWRQAGFGQANDMLKAWKDACPGDKFADFPKACLWQYHKDIQKANETGRKMEDVQQELQELQQPNIDATKDAR